MKRFLIVWTLPAALVVFASAVLFVWITNDPTWDMTERLPGGDGRPASLDSAAGPIKIEGKLETFAALSPSPMPLTGSWPRFRGADFDGISKEEVKLAHSWPAGGPPVLWSLDVGEGFAGAAIHEGRVYIIDYDNTIKQDMVRCLSLADGEELWRYSYPIKVKRYHGMTRTVPAVTDKYVVTIGPYCHTTCLDAKTGEFKWMLNLVAEYKTKIPMWHTAQCPIIEDGKVILAPAGAEVLMMAVDCETGEVAWKTPNPDGWVMTHSSIVPMDFAEKRFYVYSGGDDIEGGVIGVSAADGSVGWKTDLWKVQISVPMPVIVGQDRLFVSAGYDQKERSCGMLKLIQNGSNIDVERLFLYDSDVFSTMNHTPIFYNGHIYGVRLKDKQLICMDQQGKVVWSSTSAHKFGDGPYMIADGMIIAMDDDGLLRLVEASPAGYKQLAEALVFEDGFEAWGPLALASGRLILRDYKRMKCLDLTVR